MKIRSIFHVLVLLMALLTFNSHSAFGREPPPAEQRPTERGVDRKQNAVLLIGDHEGIDETDAQNAALLVAEELRKQGISVGVPVHDVPTSANIYRVVLRRSDEKILFRLSQEDSAGTILIEREILLTGIEDITIEAPRLVYALVHQEQIISHPVLVNGGVFMPVVPLKGVGVGVGLAIDRLSYAMEIGFRNSYGWTEEDWPRRKRVLRFRSMSIGGRYFFSKRSVSPYVGGGFAGMFAKYTTATPGFLFGWSRSSSKEAFGVGAYGVLGIEFRRYSRGRLKIELRVDRPFFKLPSQDIMPITLGIGGSRSF